MTARLSPSGFDLASVSDLLQAVAPSRVSAASSSHTKRFNIFMVVSPRNYFPVVGARTQMSSVPVRTTNVPSTAATP